MAPKTVKDIIVVVVCTRTAHTMIAKPDDPRLINGVWVEYRVKSVKNSTTPIVGEDITKEKVDALIDQGVEVNIVRS